MCLGVPGRIESIINLDSDSGTDSTPKNLDRKAKVSFSGVQTEVNLSLVPEAKVGDYVIVHVGVALSILDENAAKQTLDLLDELGVLDGVR